MGCLTRLFNYGEELPWALGNTIINFNIEERNSSTRSSHLAQDDTVAVSPVNGRRYRRHNDLVRA